MKKQVKAAKKQKDNNVIEVKESFVVVTYDADNDVSTFQIDSVWTKEADAILRLKRIFNNEEEWAKKHKTKLVPVYVPAKIADANQILFLDKKTKKQSFDHWHIIERVLTDYRDFLA